MSKGYIDAIRMSAKLADITDQEAMAQALAMECPGTAHGRANAMTAFYAAATYNPWFDFNEDGLAGANEYRLRCWAQILNDPWLNQELVEEAVHQHMHSADNYRMLPADVRVAAALIRLEQEANRG